MNSRDTNNLPLAQPLTPREQEILNCIGDGLTNRQMAEHLTIAAGTVKWYVRQVYNKLGVSSRAEAATRARGLGLLPAGDQEGAVRHNLLAAATPFVGREAELDALAELIADPQVRIITLTGPGGIGKTRLSLEVAGRELKQGSQFPDGIFFASLAPLESAVEILSTLAAVLDFHFQGLGNEADQLLNYLRLKRILLVMDNFEHILDGRELLVQMSEQAEGINLLVTSRERLQLRGEQLFPLGGLEMAEGEDSAAESAASQLFLNIARRSVPNFELHDRDAENLLHICRLVEGMPLGLELAASWVGLLPLSKIAEEIEQSLDLLASEQSDVPRRHQSMKAALNVSWRRLTSEQQRAFKELTVFRGGFTRTAAVEVAGASLPLLITLVNKSWLTYDRRKDRYHIHELLRQYGAEKLNGDPNHEREVRERHSTFFCDYLYEREGDWFGPRQKDSAAEIREDIDNIQHAWHWAASLGNTNQLAQGLNSLCRFYLRESKLQDGQKACLSAADGLSRSIIEQPADLAQRLALWARTEAWKSEFVNEISQKEVLLVRSQQLLDRTDLDDFDTRADQAFVYLTTAFAIENRDLDEAIKIANRGLALYRQLGNRWGEGKSAMVIGFCHFRQGDFAKADDRLRRSLDISRQLGDMANTIESSMKLGIVTRVQGNFEEAEILHTKSLRLAQQLQDRFLERMCLSPLPITLAWAGNFLAAREVAERAKEIDQDLAQLPNPWALNALTKVDIHLGRYREASSRAAEVLDLAQQRGIPVEINRAKLFLGNIAFAEGDFGEAQRHLLESAAGFQALKHVHQVVPLAVLSHVARAKGDKKAAYDYLGSALGYGVEHHFIYPLIICLPAAALLAADDGHPRKAVELYGLAQQFGHISNSRWFEDIACRELDEVRASIPLDVASATEARGRELDVWETAETLLRELEGRSSAL